MEEVGENFPYRNMKDMLQAALDGKLSVPGYDNSITSIEATTAKAQLAALKEKTMASLETIKADTMSYATSAYPDEESKTHYKALSEKLGNFPQGAAGWADFRTKMEAEVDEMAKMASKKADEHHGHEEGKVSPAEEFEAKYGRSLEEMQERMNEVRYTAHTHYIHYTHYIHDTHDTHDTHYIHHTIHILQYKSDPKGFLENSIIAKFGQKGLDVWKKSESFSAGDVSEADKTAAEKAFADFLKSA